MSILTPILRLRVQRNAQRALAPESGTVTLEGLKAPARVVTDSGGIPHILAENEPDLFFAQGWLHGRERLWQMELTRRVALGELAELMGDKPLAGPDVSVHLRGRRLSDLDLFIRAFGVARAARASWALCSERTGRVVAAYAAGLNRAVEEQLDQGRLPPEFLELKVDPRPWEALDVVLLTKMLAFSLAYSWKSKLASAFLAHQLGDDLRAQELLPPEYPAKPRIIPDAQRAGPRSEPALSGAGGGGPTVADLLSMERSFRRAAGLWGEHQGSNSWAVCGDRSASGMPLLANDPHLTLTAPSSAMLCHLQGGGHDVLGASFPGTPGIVIGRNRRIAWGITNVMADDVDWFIERCHPEDPRQYRDGDEWQKFQVVEETIRIKDSPWPRRRYRLSRHGPVMTDVLAGNGIGDDFSAVGKEVSGVGLDGQLLQQSGFGIGLESTDVLAMSWTAEQLPGCEIEVMLNLGQAQGWDEFRSALEPMGAPGQNVVYADVEGRVGYQATGFVPLRRGGAQHRPVPGWTGEGDWDGQVPFDEMPRILEPEAGVVVTANNKITDDSYPHYISDYWEPPYRARRITERLYAYEMHTVESFAAVQRDVYSIQGREIVQGVIAPLADEIRRSWPGDLRVLDSLIGGRTWDQPWDFRCDVESRGAAAFHAFLVALAETLLRPVLGPSLYQAFAENLNEHIQALESLLTRGDSRWVTPRARPRVVSRALKRAAEMLDQECPDGEWRWGRIHQVTFAHAFHSSAIAAPLFDIGPFESPGSSFTPWNGQFYFTAPFHQVVGSALRMVHDLGEDPPCCHALVSTGRSGNPGSPRYREDVPKWFSGGLHRLDFDESRFSEGAACLTLQPGHPVST